VESLQVETSFIKKDFNLLKTEMELCAKEKNDRWANHLEVRLHPPPSLRAMRRVSWLCRGVCCVSCGRCLTVGIGGWALQKYYKDIEKQLTKLGEMEEGFKKDVTYFGERSADDLSSFFSDWDKFTQSFQVPFDTTHTHTHTHTTRHTHTHTVHAAHAQ
jgi:hypothetical protein